VKESILMPTTGKTIGHIRVVKLVGRGGMGKVYEGFDETLKRKVAVKAIRAKTRRDPKAKSRFMREARALSQLQHPNICQIYDYIEEDQRDYLILEFIEGLPLRDAIKSGIETAQKLKISEKIAGVLAAAHEKNIIHRDLKPSNVMLTQENEAKVLDFGLSRFVEVILPEGRPDEPEEAEPTEPSVTDEDEIEEDLEPTELPTKTIPVTDAKKAPDSGSTDRGVEALETDRGTVMGTPLYMSPEQARGERLSTASDIYSFGLLLQELFTEELPYEETHVVETVIEKAKVGDTLPVVGLSSDLTTLINRLKSLAPAARPTAVEAVERLQQIREKPKRRARRIIAASIVAVFVIMGIKYTLDLRRERRLAVQARDEATQVVRFMVDLFEVTDPGEARGRSITAREILERGAREIEYGLQGQPLTRARLMDTIGTVYRKLGLYGDSEPLLESAKEIRTQEVEADNPLIAESLQSLAMLYESQGKFDEAKDLAQQSMDLREAELGAGDPAVAENLRLLGKLLNREGKLEESESLFRRALEICEKAFGTDHVDVAESLQTLGVACYYLNRFDEAEGYYKRALSIREQQQGEDHPNVASVLQSMGALYHWIRRFDEAEVAYKRTLDIRKKTLGPEHPEVATTLDNLGLLFEYQNRHAEAEPYYHESLEIRKKALGEYHPAVAESYYAFAYLKHSLGHQEEAASFYERALIILEKVHGPVHAELPPIIHNLALLYSEMGRQKEAEALHDRGLSVRKEVWGTEHPRVSMSLMSLGYFYSINKRLVEAEEVYAQALSILEKAVGPDHYRVAETLQGLGHVYEQMGRHEEAEKLFLQGLAICEKNEQANPKIKADLLHNLGYLYHMHFKRYEEAEDYYKQAYELGEAAYGGISEEVKETIKHYSELLRTLGREVEAETLEERLKAKK
jgi:serine/threonine-protein kinase